MVSVWKGEQRHDEAEARETTDDGAPPQENPPLPADIGLDQGEREDVTAPALMHAGCHRIDYWRVTWSGDAVEDTTKLLDTCNDGYGAASVGQDTITIGDNAFTHAVSGGSAWRWSDTTERTLTPLRTRRTSSFGYWNVSVNFQETQWSFDDFAGTTSWYSPPCDANGAPDLPPALLDSGPGERGDHEYTFASIPQAEVDASFATSGWKTAGLGRCALSIDGTGKGGFVTYGKPGEASDATLRVFSAPPGTLYVEIEDDKLVGPSANWVRDDHLEIWLGKALPSYDQHCVDAGNLPQQWGIRVADGKVFPAFGKPDALALSVERAAPAGGVGPVRFKIVLPGDHEALTVVYSDSDGGKQERLLATSKLAHGKLPTLGKVTRFPREVLTCQLVEGRLTPVEVVSDAAAPRKNP